MKFDDSMIITAGLGEMKAYRIEKSEAIVNDELKISYTPKLIQNINYIDGRKKLHEVVTDSAGRFGHDIAEEHNLENERKRRTLEDVAASIDETVEQERPKKLFVAFAQEINEKLVEQLSENTRKLIVKNLTANLVKTDKNKLLSYFE